MKTFPKPLSALEEKMYLEQLQQGNQAAKDILIERNMRLVAHMVKKYAANEWDTEDLISVGSIGLMKAINTFDPTKATRLGTYAAKCIDNVILSSKRFQVPKKKCFLQRTINGKSLLSLMKEIS